MSNALLPKTGHRRGLALGWALLALFPVTFVGTLLVYPAVSLAVQGLSQSSGLGLGADPQRVLDAALMTVLSGTLGAAGSLLVGVPLAWALYRRSWRGISTVRGIVASPFALPTIIVALAFSSTFREGGVLEWTQLDGTLWTIILAFMFYNISVVARVVGESWSRVDTSLAAVSRTLGASRLRTFGSITLPQLKHAIAAAGLLVFAYCASSFAVVLILGANRVSTLETELYRSINRSLDLRTACVLALLQLCVVCGSLIISMRIGARSVRTESRGHSVSVPGSGRDAVMVAGIIALYAVFIAAPMANLLIGAFSEGDTWTLEHFVRAFTMESDRTSATSVVAAAARSSFYALVSSLIALSMGLVTVVLAHVQPSAGRILTMFCTLPLAVSPVFLGAAILVGTPSEVLGVDLRSSPILLIMLQALVALPLVVSTLSSALQRSHRSLRDVASTLGASPIRAIAKVDLALVTPALGSAWSLGFATAAGEFGAAAMLSRPDEPTLPALIYHYFTRPGADNVGLAYAATVILTLICAGSVVLGHVMQPKWSRP